MLDYNTEFTVNTVDMNLAETCNYLQISTINAINEFQTTVLLSEYGYLLENGCEIDYDTDGNDIITEGVMDLFTKIKEWIKATYEKLVNWITDRIDDVRQWFSKVGLKKEKASKAVKIYAEAYRGFDKQFLPTFSGLWVNVKKLESAFPSILDQVKDVKSNFLKKIAVQNIENPIIITPDYVKISFENVFDTGNVVKSIRTSQAQAIKQIEDMMHIAQRSNADAAVIDNLKNGIRAVSDVSRELVKLYRDGIQSSITILKKVISCISNTDAVARAYRKVGNIRKAKIAAGIVIAATAIGLGVWKRKEVAAGATRGYGKGREFIRKINGKWFKTEEKSNGEIVTTPVKPSEVKAITGKTHNLQQQMKETEGSESSDNERIRRSIELDKRGEERLQIEKNKKIQRQLRRAEIANLIKSDKEAQGLKKERDELESKMNEIVDKLYGNGYTIAPRLSDKEEKTLHNELRKCTGRIEEITKQLVDRVKQLREEK